MAQEAHNGGAPPAVSETVIVAATANPVVFTAVKPQIFVEAPKATDAVQFYKAAFGAEEITRVVHPKRKADQETPLILVSELKIGSSIILVSDLVADDSAAPVKAVTTGNVFCLETEGIEAAVEKAVKAGAVKDAGEATEGCCGTAGGGAAVGDGGGAGGSKLKDPYGNVWLICGAVKKSDDVEA